MIQSGRNLKVCRREYLTISPKKHFEYAGGVLYNFGVLLSDMMERQGERLAAIFKRVVEGHKRGEKS